MTTAPPIVNQVLSTPGKVLDSATQETMSARLHHDFGKVRVHADSRAAASAQALDATAYTFGQHVVFDQGRYAPHSLTGQQLLAHELVHTMQQDRGGASAGSLAIAEPSESSEKSAEQASSAALARKPFTVESQPARIQRQMNQKPKVDLAESASPLLAGAIGSVAIDGFDTGKADISKANRTVLEGTGRTIQTLLKKYPGSSIQVTGHTDAVGKEENNLALGQARAESARSVLIAAGVPADSIAIASKGETALLIKTERAEPRNRRVEVKFEPLTSPVLGATREKSSATAASSFGQGGIFETPRPPDFRVPTTTPDRPGPIAAPPPAPTREPQSKIGEINALTELIKKTSDAVKRDPLVRRLRDLMAEMQPLMPAKDAKKAIDDAIDGLVKSGSDAALKAILQAITGRAPTEVTEKEREHTGPLLPKKDLGERIFSTPSLPLPFESSKPPPKLSYEYRGGVRKSYAPGAAIKFTLIAPDKPLEGAKRLVIIADVDRNEPNPKRFDEVELGSAKSQIIELTAPKEPGKYVFRVNAGLSFDYSSVEEFEVTASSKQ